MSSDNNPSGGGFSLQTLSGYVMGFGARLLVHFFALIVALLAASPAETADGGIFGSAAFKFSVYIGLVCLVPRGMGNRADWLIPTGSGLALTLLSFLQGIPPMYAVVWGGAATWLIRLILRKGQFDWEMTAIPWLFITLFSSATQQLPQIGASPPFILFVLVVAAGSAGKTLYARYRGNAAQRAMLLDACDRMEKKAASGLPAELEKKALELARKGRRLLRVCGRFDTGTASLVNAYAATADQLVRVVSPPTDGFLRRYLASLEELNGEVEKLLASIEEEKRASSPQAAMDRELARRIEGFRESSSDLQAKARSLPVKVKGHVDGIALATDKIIICMRDDPADVPLGDRFLSRYLSAAHKLVDDYARLSAQGGDNQGIAETLLKCEALLERLQNAFEEEHARLLRNDTIDFTAELNVLDKLLKMDGR